MLKVGMTGGIASGKTQATKFFTQLGCQIIDADVVARQLVEIGTPAWQAIVTHFGVSILKTDRCIDRQRLGRIIFTQAEEKKWLEELLHPEVRKTIIQRIEKEIDTPYCIIVIPLLAENLPNPLINRILVIDTEEKNQLHRAMQRDGTDKDTVKAIMATQASRQQRLAIADDIIENNTSSADLQVAVQKMHNFYLRLAENAT